MVGRDVQVAAAVTASAADTIKATRKVVTAVSAMQEFPLSQRGIARASTALLQLSRTLDAGREQVRSTRPASGPCSASALAGARWPPHGDYLMPAGINNTGAPVIGGKVVRLASDGAGQHLRL